MGLNSSRVSEWMVVGAEVWNMDEFGLGQHVLNGVGATRMGCGFGLGLG